MEALAVYASDVLVRPARRAAADPAADRQSQRMIVVPDPHAVPDHGMDVHAVEEGELRDVDGKLLEGERRGAVATGKSRYRGYHEILYVSYLGLLFRSA